MSHFATLKTQLKNKSTLTRVLKDMGWIAQLEAEHINSWSQEKLTDVTVIRDANGQVKACIDGMGNVIHDSYYMGDGAFRMIQNYAASHIKDSASLSGGQVTSTSVNSRGEMILEVCYE